MELVVNLCRESFLSVQTLLVYTHVIIFCFSVMLFFLIRKNNKPNITKNAFLTICFLVIIWIALNAIIWFGYSIPIVVQSAWAPIELISTLIFVFIFNFIYIINYKEGLNLNSKIQIILVLLPIIIFAPTQYYVSGYNFIQCEAIENPIYILYVSGIKILFSLLSVIFLLKLKRMKVLANQYSNILIVAFISFLFSFFIASYISSITEQYSYELYGLFGIIIFLSCFAYLVSTEKLFDTKVFAAQILVGVLFIVNLPSIFFYTKSIDVFLWSAESMVILILGYYLISSVKSEITQREELSAKKIELEEKNTKLVELNATKDEFLSFATHQLKSPLTSIKWGIESLHDSHLAPEQDMLASQIKIVTNQMVRTVNDFLNSAKLEAGQLSITKTKTELAVLVQKIINEFRPIAESKHLQLLGEFPNRRVTVGIDDAKIEQVLANIVDNAIKYTPTGSIVVSICIQRSFAVISVRDTGAGITRSDINKLFKKYVRGSAAKLNTAGSGIGLYLAKQIVELHSGTLTIKSKGKGFGTEFVISLPFTDV